MRKTKIICTLGPACDSEPVLKQMLKNGMNIARLNFSHQSHDYHADNIATIKKLRHELNMPVAILLDTRGPEIRIGKFKNGRVTLSAGDTFTLTTDECEGDESRVYVNCPILPAQVKAGDKLLLDDGLVTLKVESATQSDIVTTVVVGGELSGTKGVNVPGVHIDLPFLSDKDKEDLLFGIEHDVDFIAASFTRSAGDITEMRNFVNYNGGHDIRIIAKIVTSEGIENFDEILAVADGIMVARGDLGVEIEYDRVPGIQKRLIKQCYRSGKMVITATQMLESMIHSQNPTRAEISDVANAVFDGTSAIMLSGESAIGVNPPRVVKVMAEIAQRAETDAISLHAFDRFAASTDTRDITGAICDATCRAALDLNATAIIAVTKNGETARLMSKYRPNIPIVGATPSEKTYHQLSLSWGVTPVLSRYQATSDELFRHAVDCAKMIGLVKKGDRVVITAGIPLGISGTTNTLRVQIVE